MQSASTMFHLLGALRRAIGRVLLWFFVTGILAAAVVEGVGYFAVGHPNPYHPALLTHVAAIVAGVVLAYTAALTVMVGEVIRFAVSSAQKAEQEIKGEVGGAAKFLDAAMQTVEHRERK